ncbi:MULTISPECIES: hypothetical protein [unclassified Kribbella]
MPLSLQISVATLDSVAPAERLGDVLAQLLEGVDSVPLGSPTRSAPDSSS